MNAPLKTANVPALSIYLMRVDGAIVVNSEEVEQFARVAARRKVEFWTARKAAGTLPRHIKVPTFEEALVGARNGEERNAAIELAYAIRDADPGREMSELEVKFLMSGEYTRD